MKPYIWLPLAAALLLDACCCAPSTDYALYWIDKAYVGHTAGEFFRSYGYPSGVYSSANNGRVYQWTSIPTPPRLTPSNSTTYYTGGGSGYYHLTDNYQGTTAREYCELRIYADSADIIRGIAVAVDSAGVWSNSRCAEIFSGTYP